jgi:SM-20-related protein
MDHSFRHCLLDGFLPEDLRSALLEYALQNEAAFEPSGTLSHGTTETYRPEFRVSLRLPDGLGPFRSQFKKAVVARFTELIAVLGMEDFALSGVEVELTAHRNGAFFRAHIDTMTRNLREGRPSDRMISLVYYFHAQPQRFTGGELVLYPLGKGDPLLVEPCDNRLLAFPSFAIHEVKQVHCVPDDFRNARFAINCWLHRARATEKPAEAAKAVS